MAGWMRARGALPITRALRPATTALKWPRGQTTATGAQRRRNDLSSAAALLSNVLVLFAARRCSGIPVYVFSRWRVRQVEAQFNAVLAERNRIAREIHDTLAQGFVAVSLQLELLARKLGRRSRRACEI